MTPDAPQLAVNARDPSLAQVLARNLVVARDLHAMTQHDLAARSGVSRATIAHLEAGNGDPRLSTVSLLAEALGVSLMVLLVRRDEVRAIAGVEQNLAARPVRPSTEEAGQLTALAQSGEARDQRRAARIAATIARTSGCRTVGGQTTASLLALSDVSALPSAVAIGRQLERP